MLYTTLLMAPTANGKPDYMFLIMMGGVFVIMYFFMIRPQSKKMREQREYLTKLQKGDKIVTTGGIHGKLISIDEKTANIEIANGVQIKLERNGISYEMSTALNKPEAKA